MTKHIREKLTRWDQWVNGNCARRMSPPILSDAFVKRMVEAVAESKEFMEWLET